VNCYSEAVDAINVGGSSNEAVERYWSGAAADPSYGLAKIEVLVSKAMVIRKLF
jgi:hypothetical protein